MAGVYVCVCVATAATIKTILGVLFMCKQRRQRHIITGVVAFQNAYMHSSHTPNQLNHSEMKVLQSLTRDGYTYSRYVELWNNPLY